MGVSPTKILKTSFNQRPEMFTSKAVRIIMHAIPWQSLKRIWKFDVPERVLKWNISTNSSYYKRPTLIGRSPCALSFSAASLPLRFAAFSSSISVSSWLRFGHDFETSINWLCGTRQIGHGNRQLPPRMRAMTDLERINHLILSPRIETYCSS